jgi:3-isopropylmalate/(R)-2-methylmalate dehydratase small subunit
MRAWVFGDNVDTDVIAPQKHLAKTTEELVKHILEPVAPRFASEVEKGDLIVAGRNFGCGSSREQAALGLKYLGVKAIIAESFARIFFRNSISIGLPVLTCTHGLESFKDGDEVEFSLTKAFLKNGRTGMVLALNPLPPFMIHIIEEGGILPILKKKYEGINVRHE